MKPWKRNLLIVLALVALVGLVAGGIAWSRRGTVAVQVGKVGREDLASIVTASGQIKPPVNKWATVNANSYGKIVEMNVQEGDHVKKGQLIMRTEDIQQEADVNAQQAALKTAEANADASGSAVQSAAAGMKTAEANLQQAEAKLKQAEKDYKRGQQLVEDNLIAQQIFDQRRSDYLVAQANLNSAQAQVAQNKALYQQAVYNRDMVNAQVMQSKATLVRFADVRNKTVYTSPVDGVITSLPVHLGENVVAGIQNAAGSYLYQVSDLSVITAEVKVDETDIVNVKLNQPAEVTIDAIPNKTFKGRVTQIGEAAVNRSTGQAAATSSSTTGTATDEEAKDFLVVVTLDNPPPGMHPGLSTTAKITTATRQNAISIPIQALTIRTRAELEDANKPKSGTAMAAERQPPSAKEREKAKEEVQGVFAVKNGVAQFIPVETGVMGSIEVEVLKGVSPGDTIVTGSYQVLRTLKNHTKIKVVQAPPPGTPAAQS